MKERSDKPSITIRTSEKDWLVKLAKAYKERVEVNLINDANLEIDPSTDTLARMGIKTRLSTEQWMAVGVSLGMGGVGVGMVFAAIIDPEPTSKLGLLVCCGSTLVLGGGFNAARILSGSKPPTVELTPAGFRISWD